MESLSYPEDTAARIMQREFTAVPSNWSVGQTIDYLRENNNLPEEFLEIFIINEDGISLQSLDSGHISFIQMLLKKDAFSRFIYNKNSNNIIIIISVPCTN